MTNDKLVELILGREEDEMYQMSSSAKQGEEILSVQHLRFEPKIVDVSFTLHSGEILGIAGLLGSGRTELVRTIFGLSKSDSGDLFVNGKLEVIQNPNHAIKLGFGYITEDRHKEGLILEKSIKDNIILGNLKKYANNFGFMLQSNEINTAEKHKKQLNIITPSIFRKVKYLSGGNQQKVVLSKWLETKPKIFILDDPTRGIDVGAKAEFYKLISKLAEQGAGIIFISSELQEIISICQRILVLRNGRILSEYSGNNISAPKILKNMTGDL
jgi:ABC-type sugar transport system ATPase subunit